MMHGQAMARSGRRSNQQRMRKSLLPHPRPGRRADEFVHPPGDGGIAGRPARYRDPDGARGPVRSALSRCASRSQGRSS